MMEEAGSQQLDRDQILKDGKVEIRVMRQGVFQRIEFVIKLIDGPFGKYPVLATGRQIDMKELVKLAEKIDLPIQGTIGTAYPKGKSGKDFVDLLYESML